MWGLGREEFVASFTINLPLQFQSFGVQCLQLLPYSHTILVFFKSTSTLKVPILGAPVWLS